MGRLDPEPRMTIKALAGRGMTRSEIARLLGVTEGAVQHRLRRMSAVTRGGLGQTRFSIKAPCRPNLLFASGETTALGFGPAGGAGTVVVPRDVPQTIEFACPEVSMPRDACCVRHDA
jgi:hypothetical protein